MIGGPFRRHRWPLRLCSSAKRRVRKASAFVNRWISIALVPFGLSSADKLMKIAEHPQLSDTAHVRYLPSALTTLYDLTKVPDKVLDNAFRDGLITP